MSHKRGQPSVEISFGDLSLYSVASLRGNTEAASKFHTTNSKQVLNKLCVDTGEVIKLSPQRCQNADQCKSTWFLNVLLIDTFDAQCNAIYYILIFLIYCFCNWHKINTCNNFIRTGNDTILVPDINQTATLVCQLKRELFIFPKECFNQ